MEGHRFDRLTQAVAHRLSRRAALRQGAVGTVAALIPAAAASNAASEESPVATSVAPMATPEATGTVPLLFVQVFGSGSIAPKSGESGVYVLTLRDGLASTIAFSDRPARLTEALPADRLPNVLDFSPDDPPNAAMVSRTGSGDEAVLLVELFAPRFDPATRTATYDAKVLANYGRFGSALAARARPIEQMPADFAQTSLFIDAGGCIGLGNVCDPNGGSPCCNVGFQTRCVPVTCTPNQPTTITGFTTSACLY